ncbi:2-amino-4-hydroxy-6-hydroxymethyldihydropteridine diphosphokinase [Kroppenstedtia eburnea]|uniref:2-amino-4-hydroxy-6-hydroxymethyldihydropteridine diphosphokinase n=1 Tax=Kroppenstedtia eburnea TaxID=714067 RepID=A0A1N7MUL0_9BACL|nr:2-amino-4-hydroxy-6-hydroxymethyldihydropteridine diphosphokinase [Kroppenstedtia eburnea]QKI80671.1 2-amino-4-hydroxy-6-hydroxymethyldihydropteridine diphosphokinase [Kroppenstedtia eburnea]SIS89813.1 2-amino-4-hydroxy-6-hydroxymethyldihydropteridinediphosphokinase [Kroppenstedtia eburnea]
MSQAMTAHLGLGSNLGDRRLQLEEALRRLHRREGIQLTRLSSLYETAPVGFLDQPPFLNLCAEIRTTLSPAVLLRTLLQVEQELHRVRRVRWGPRTIDVDLLLYGDRILREERLTVPHPRMTERPFVLIPLAEIAGEIPVPGTGKTVHQWRAEMGTPEDVVPLPNPLTLEQVTT